jgi:hypothetical protein
MPFRKANRERLEAQRLAAEHQAAQLAQLTAVVAEIAARENAEGDVTTPIPTRVKLRTRVLVFAIFTGIFGLLPMFVVWVVGTFHGSGIGYTELVGKGELLLISAVIAGAAFGEVFAAARGLGRRSPPAEGLTELIYWINAIAIFAALVANLIIYVAILPTSPYESVRNWSSGLFVLTLLSSCVVVGGVVEESQ